MNLPEIKALSWADLLERIAKGLGATLHDDCVIQFPSSRTMVFQSSAGLSALNYLESLAIQQRGEDAFAETVRTYFSPSNFPDTESLLTEVYRPDARTRAEVIALCLEGEKKNNGEI